MRQGLLNIARPRIALTGYYGMQEASAEAGGRILAPMTKPIDLRSSEAMIWQVMGDSDVLRPIIHAQHGRGRANPSAVRRGDATTIRNSARSHSRTTILTAPSLLAARRSRTVIPARPRPVYTLCRIDR